MKTMKKTLLATAILTGFVSATAGAATAGALRDPVAQRFKLE